MTRDRLVQIAVVALLIAIFVLLRVWKIDETCLWFDEIFSVHAASQPWNSILSFAALDLIHPPLFYVLLKEWITIGGDSLSWVRMLPLLFSALTIVPIYLIVKELKQNLSHVLLTVLFVVVSGTLLKYSVDVRMYSLLAFLAVCSKWIFTRYLNRGVGFIPLMAVNILLVYTHYFGWLIILSELVAILILDRKKVFHFTAHIGLALLAFFPWAYAVWNASAQSPGLSQNIGWVSRPGLREIVGFAFNLVEPFYFQTGSSEPVSNFLITIPLLGSVLAAILVMGSSWKDINPETRNTIWLLQIFIVVPIVGAFTVSWVTPYSVWGTRHLIIVLLPFYIFLSVVFSTLRDRRLRVTFAVVGILIFSSAAIFQLNQTAPKFAWCELGPLTTGISEPRIPIYTVEDLLAYHLWFEHRYDSPQQKVMRLDGVDGVREDKAYFLPRGFDDVERVDLADLSEDKFWLVHRAVTLSESEPPLRNLTVKGYRITDTKITKADGESVGLYLLER